MIKKTENFMNNFTAETRRQLKREQKARVMENLGRCIGIQLMYLVPYMLLMVILYVSVFGRAFALIAGGASINDYQLMAALSRGLNTVWLCIALMLAITGPLQFGLMHFYIGLAHGEDVTVGTLMYPFTSLKSVWAGIRMVFTLWLRGIIWSIVPTVIYSAIVFATAVTISDTAQYQVIAGALQVVYLLVMIPIRVKLQTYNAGWLLLAQDENRSAWAAAREASWAFRGNLMKLFMFDLSFIGWYVLIAVVLWGCILLGTVGVTAMSTGMAIAVFAAALVAALCLTAVLNGFLSAYMESSFVRVYEQLTEPSVEFYPEG